MKKIAILTSVLALAACGGGSGHHHDGTPVTPGANNPATVPGDKTIGDAARASNREITSMASEILIAKDGSLPNIARDATGSVNHNGKEYTAYRLDDAKFVMADIPDEDDPDIAVKFTTDADGKIIGTDMLLWGENIKTRREEGNKFSFNENGVSAIFETKMGKGDAMGMKYSDFGYVDVDWSEDGETVNEHFAIAGGYDVMRIEAENISGEKTFTGQATGNVSANDAPMAVETDDATLVFKDGVQTLNMNFDNWYNVTVTSADGKNNIAFDDTEKNIAAGYKFKHNEYEDFTRVNHVTEGVSGRMNTSYYGDKGNATEATALISIDEKDGQNEVLFNAAFGGVAK